jgi:hypothetical protein
LPRRSQTIPPDQQARIRNTDRYNAWAIRLPISERNRLLQHFAAIESTGTPIDLIVLADTIDFAGLPGPPAEQFRPVFFERIVSGMDTAIVEVRHENAGAVR